MLPLRAFGYDEIDDLLKEVLVRMFWPLEIPSARSRRKWKASAGDTHAEAFRTIPRSTSSIRRELSSERRRDGRMVLSIQTFMVTTGSSVFRVRACDSAVALILHSTMIAVRPAGEHSLRRGLDATDRSSPSREHDVMPMFTRTTTYAERTRKGSACKRTFVVFLCRHHPASCFGDAGVR